MLQATKPPLPAQLPHKHPSNVTLFNWLVVLAIPAIVGISVWSWQRLVDPLFSVSVVDHDPQYPSFPRTLAQIQSELARYGLSLGERLDLGDNYVIYGVLGQDQQGLTELRIYEQIGGEKLVLHQILPISGLDETTVRSGSSFSGPRRWRLLPIEQLDLIPDAPSGKWIAVSGKQDGILYGRVVMYQSQPRPRLQHITEWSSSAGQLPQWRRLLDLPQPQLVVDQTQKDDPLYQVFLLETDNKTNLRKIHLPQPLAIRRLAEVGLWSRAQAQFDTLRAERRLTPAEQEQYALISYHARLIAEKLSTAKSIQERIYCHLLAGEWQTALELLHSSPQAQPQIADLLQERQEHIWLRINAVLQLDPATEERDIKAWGALAQLARGGFRQAETWLRQNQADTQANLQLLQQLDLAPVGIAPQFLIGRATPHPTLPPGDWLLPPPPLPPDQTWFTVDIDVIGERQTWLNGPFPALRDRSSLLIWRVLGLKQQPHLILTTPQGRQFTLTAHSYSISPTGALQILATGSSLASEAHNYPAIVSSDPLPQIPDHFFFSLSWLPPDLHRTLLQNLTHELETLGRVNINLEQMLALSLQWRFYPLDMNGDGKQEFLLYLTRPQINLGDRPYPIVVVFNSAGQILFSDIRPSTGKRWVSTLFRPIQTSTPLLIEQNGKLQVWQP
ncbi:MAG: hypothetical protein ACK4QL_06055 [Pseudanabaenaceae cyanobacterium]